jgi:Na+/proline symporter
MKFEYRANEMQILTTWVLKRYNNELQTSEMFSTAGRTVKSGLVASAVVSSWTWAATLLQSTSVAYRYGMLCKYIGSQDGC